MIRKMPRNRALKGTSMHPYDTGSFVPYIEDFVKLLAPSETVTKTSDLLTSYLLYVNIRTDTRDLLEQAKRGFRRKLKQLAHQRRISESTSPRGYYVSEPKFPRHAATNIRTRNLVSKLFDVRFIDKKIGKGAFAICDIPVDSKLTEYRGEWVTRTQHKVREEYYAEHNLPPVAVFVNNLVLDGNRNEKGDLFTEGDNVARYFNHSKLNPNCKLVSNGRGTNRKLFLVSKQNIPHGTHLTWDYGDKSSTSYNPWLAF